MFKKTISLYALLAFSVALLPAMAQADGKELFVEKKCTKCHSIQAEGVEKHVSKSGKKKKGPDLSGVGLGGHDDAFLAKFLKKEAKKDSVYKDKQVKHKKKFKGSDEDLATIVAFLQKQKTKVDVAADDGEDDADDDE